MNLPFDFRIGNIIDYSGSLGQFNNVRILDITPADETRQLFTLQKPYEKEKTFAGYTGEVFPIFLREGHLQQLEFKFHEQSKRHVHNHIMIGSFGYAEGKDRMNMTYINTGFKIIPVGFPAIPTLEQVKAGTVDMPYLHALQNYCSDKAIKDIDFDKIKF